MRKKRRRICLMIDYFLTIMGFLLMLSSAANIEHMFFLHHKKSEDFFVSTFNDTFNLVFILGIFLVFLFLMKYIVQKSVLSYLSMREVISDDEYNHLKKSSDFSATIFACIWLIISFTYSLAILISGSLRTYLDILPILLSGIFLFVGLKNMMVKGTDYVK